MRSICHLIVQQTQVVIGRGDAEPIKVVLDTREPERAEAQYEEVRATVEEAQRVNAPAVDLSDFAASAAGVTVDPGEVTSIDVVDPGEVTSIDFVDADEDLSPGQYGPSADYGEG